MVPTNAAPHSARAAWATLLLLVLSTRVAADDAGPPCIFAPSPGVTYDLSQLGTVCQFIAHANHTPSYTCRPHGSPRRRGRAAATRAPHPLTPNPNPKP